MNHWEIALGLATIAAAATGLVLPWLVGLHERAGWVNSNYRGEEIPTGTGLLLLAGITAAWAWLGLLARLGVVPPTNAPVGAGATLIWSFALLGFLDDVGGSGEHGGFSSHFRSLAQGRLTTGGLKALGGGLVAAYVALEVVPDWLGVVVGALTLALGANFLNLLDLRPGRGIKGYLVLTFLGLVGSGFAPETLVVAAAGIGASLAFLPGDLRGQIMLGDAGANLLGALAGFQFLTGGDRLLFFVAFTVLAGLNLLAEKVSFSRLIESSALLSWLDRLGQGKQGGKE
ncbi:MAG: hypothetical protein H0Z38_01560 [Firmicutes bacterium]|nr:hypothetical protein [Bacillota bacterium]